VLLILPEGYETFLFRVIALDVEVTPVKAEVFLILVKTFTSDDRKLTIFLDAFFYPVFV